MSSFPLPTAAIEVSYFFSRALGALTRSVSGAVEMWPDQGIESTTDLVVAAVAGIAAALAVALVFAFYIQSYRSVSDMVRHGLAVAITLGLIAFAAYDMRHAAAATRQTADFAQRWPQAIEFALRWQQTTERAKALAAEMEK